VVETKHSYAVFSDKAYSKEHALRFHRLKTALATTLLSSIPALATAQVTPAAGYTPPDDTPVIRVGMTLFPTYTFQTDPKITDADGNRCVKPSLVTIGRPRRATSRVANVRPAATLTC